MRHPRTTVALATAGALSLAAVPVLAQGIADTPGAATASPDATDDATGGATNEASPDAGDTTTDRESDSSRARERRGGHGHFGPMVEELSDDFAEELADELGLSPDEVADAIDRIRERWTEDFRATMEEHREEAGERLAEQLDAAVVDGALTQEQADELADLFASEDLGPGKFEDLTDEQRDALEALRDHVGEQFTGRGWGPSKRRGPGGPGGGRGDHASPDQGDAGDDSTDDSTDGATENSTEGSADPFSEPTTRESVLQAT